MTTPKIATLAGVALLATVGCASARPVYGTLGASGGLLGQWSRIVDACSSGVDISAAFGNTTVVRFDHVDPRSRHGITDGFEINAGMVNGKLMRVAVQRVDPHREVELRREMCRRFEVELRPQPDGTVGADIELDCDTGDGGRVVASVHAPSCR
jgi:hypothetical protein